MARPSGFRRVVLGLDGSTNSRRAARFLARLRAPRGARVVCVRVVEPVRVPATPPMLPKAMRAQIAHQAQAMEKQQLDRARRQVLEAAAELSREGWPARGIVRTGVPLSGLLAQARRFRADVIVVGARGAGPVKHLLLGSVAEGLVKRGPFEVLVVK
jgi:nucleotide-binding universal stress UspA family protein